MTAVGDGGAPSALCSYIARIDAFTEQILRPYVERLQKVTVGGIGAKELNDPVWGTIALSPLEVVVLDSPLLQRLRRIRQLGVAQYVYPGANHTRLEHSIGVCHQVQRLVTSLELHAQTKPLSDAWVETLRLAALCHDIGHGLMSHVVENALRFDDDCVDLILDFQDEVGKDTESQLSEIAAYYMLRSPAFEDLVVQARRIAGNGADAGMPHRMADLVIGISKDEEYPLIHEAISGPFDCDKLDYMTRDALMCGVPVVTDVTRLIQKVRAVDIRTDRLPRELQSLVEDKGGTHTIVAVSRSGASTLHEVSLARSLMHDKVYRHHKVRATEAMVAAIIQQIGSSLDPMAAMIPLSIDDDSFLALDATNITAIGTRSGEVASPSARDIGSDLAERMRERRLFVRAFAFSQKMPFDAYRKDPEQRAAIEGLIRDADEGGPRKEIVEQIAEQVQSMLRLLPDREPLPSAMEADLSAYIWIDPPVVKRKSEHDSDQNRAYLVDHGNELLQMAEVSAETRGWADAYINTRDVGYVFCPIEIAPYVHLATEAVLRVGRGITIPRQMHSYAKVVPSEVSDLRTQLQRSGYYEGLPRDLAPLPAFLTKAATDSRLTDVASRLAQYAGPTPRRDQNKAEGGVLSAAKIRNWIAQFDADHIELALQIVERMLLLDRSAINLALDTFLDQSDNEKFRSAALVPIGEPKDGSAVLTYYSGDLGGRFPVKIRSVEQALAKDSPLIFIDDIVQQGSSIISKFEAWLDLPDTRDLKEERGQPLGAGAQNELRSRPLAIVTSAGMSNGIREVEEVLTSYELDVRVYAHRLDADLPTVRSALSDVSGARVDSFLARCAEIGAALVTEKRHPDEKVLGYGNQALLVISSFNTPTMTLTALWKSGTVDGAAWRPLFPRRDKK